jgi:hypothetical protein
MLLIEGTGGGVPMVQTPVAEPPGSIYRLRVVLAGISPMIWRQLEVPGSITIAGLHEVLQVAFGWSGEHLHRFTVHGKEYGICYEGGMVFDDDPHQVRLVDLGLRERERFAYAYGFFANLESWRHDLRVQAIEAPRVRRRYPWCSAGARSAPPEDCGGPRVFQALRQEHSLWATTVRMAELTTLLLDAPPDSTGRGVLGEAVEELPELLYWSRVDCLDRAAVNRALTGHPTKGAQL